MPEFAADTMRLLGTNTGHFVEKDPKFTKYAILSHTWDKAGEQTYKELRKIQKRYGIVLSVLSEWFLRFLTAEFCHLQGLTTDCLRLLPLPHITRSTPPHHR